MIGKTIDVVVTSVLQTTAGKMIFGRFLDPSAATQGATAPASSVAAPENESVRRGRPQMPPSAAAAGK
jgi:hypothetical protein